MSNFGTFLAPESSGKFLDRFLVPNNMDNKIGWARIREQIILVWSVVDCIYQ